MGDCARGARYAMPSRKGGRGRCGGKVINFNNVRGISRSQSTPGPGIEPKLHPRIAGRVDIELKVRTSCHFTAALN